MIAIACDHTALALKEKIKTHLASRELESYDFGTFTEESCDYPLYARQAASAVADGKYELGILICGTGVGMSIAANKVRGARCVVCSEPYSAKLAREHNDANILAFGARVVGDETAKMITDAFLDASFQGGRHTKRVNMYEQD